MAFEDDGVELHFEEEGTEIHTALPAPIEAWRRRSATGFLLTGIAFGLREVFEPEIEQPAIVAEVPGEPPGDKAVDVTVDRQRPRDSLLVIRPWLLQDDE